MFALQRGLPVLFALVVLSPLALGQPGPAKKSVYPTTTRTTDGDTYHGVFAPDPYRWLESLSSSQVKDWVKGQEQFSRKHLDALPRRDEVGKVLRSTADFPRQSVPLLYAGKFYFAKNSGMQDQAVLYRAKSLDDSAPEVVLDLNKVYPDATRTLKSWSVSPDGRFLAYSVNLNGADEAEWRIRDLNTLTDYSEALAARFDYPSWHRKIDGFYYSYKGTVYFHRVGSSPSTDTYIYGESGWWVEPTVTGSGRYVVLTLGQGTDPRNRVYLRDLEAQSGPANWIVVANATADYDFICETNGSLYFRTNANADKARIVRMPLNQIGSFVEVVPEAADALDSVAYVAGVFFARYVHDGHHVVKMFDAGGKSLGTLDLPGEGSVATFTTDGTADGVLFTYSNYVTPPKIMLYRHHADESKRTTKVWFESKLDCDLSDFVQEVTSYTSKDGTKVPITLCYRKSMVKDGTNPVLLYGYGGFHVNITPAFRFWFLSWVRLGGVVAVPNLRGGAELGESWNENGSKLKKQNVFDDYLCAAQWLIDQKYTQAGRIVANGASNGGLLVGAALTQKPELFGAALPDVGVLDMVRYNKLDGTSWVSDFGDVNDKAQFNALFSYSPVHNVKQGRKYPGTLVFTADHDDRVSPAHSFKFTAALQWAQGSDRPVLLLVAKDAGHIGGYTPEKWVNLYTDMFAFALDELSSKPTAMEGQ